MVVLNRHALDAFYNVHKQAEKPLRQWFTVVHNARWAKHQDIKQTMNHADKVGAHYVFNVGGGKYRIIARVNFLAETVRIVSVLTHSEYDKIDVRKLE